MMKYEVLKSWSQWWVYDNDEDVYIDPPQQVLKELNEISEEDQEEVLRGIINQNPTWLQDRGYWYRDINL